MPEINKDLLLHRILHSGDFTALEKRYLEDLIRGSDFNRMEDVDFICKIICIICDYAVANEMPPTDTVRTLAENLTLLCEIADFDRWEAVSNVGKDTENH